MICNTTTGQHGGGGGKVRLVGEMAGLFQGMVTMSKQKINSSIKVLHICIPSPQIKWVKQSQPADPTLKLETSVSPSSTTNLKTLAHCSLVTNGLNSWNGCMNQTPQNTPLWDHSFAVIGQFWDGGCNHQTLQITPLWDPSEYSVIWESSKYIGLKKLNNH